MTSSYLVVRRNDPKELLKPTFVTSIQVSLVSTWKTLWESPLPPSYENTLEENTTVEKMDLLYSDKLVVALNKRKTTPPLEIPVHGNSSFGNSTPVAGSSGNGGSSSSSSSFTPLASLVKIVKGKGRSSGDSTPQGRELPAGTYEQLSVFCSKW